MVEQPQVVQQPQPNQERETVYLEFNPPNVEDRQNQREPEPDNYIRAIPNNQEEINDEVHQNNFNEILNKINKFKVNFKGVRLERLNPENRKFIIKKAITTHIKPDLQEKKIDITEMENAINKKAISELNRLGYDEDGEQLINLNESMISLRSEMPRNTTQNDEKNDTERAKIFNKMLLYLENIKLPDNYKETLKNSTPEERIELVNSFYRQKALDPSFNALSDDDFEGILDYRTIKVLDIYGYDANGLEKKETSKKRKRQ